MRIILKIAKNELRHLFYSPIGWLTAIIMLVVCASFYTGLMFTWAKINHVVKMNNPQYLYWMVDSVTEITFSKQVGSLFTGLIGYLNLFVPLITMGIINKEFNSGTIKLLYSSPVKLRLIILGKFLAMITYNLVLVLIIGIFVVLGFFDLNALDYAPAFSGLAGLYLFLCSMTAIGFFLSSLTNYQIISAIASFIVLLILSHIGSLWQEYEFIRDLTWFLAMANKIMPMISGLITSKDLLYYLIIIFMFVSFTLLKLKDGMESRPWYIKTGRYLVVITFCLFTGYISSSPSATLYFDTTGQKLHTIHPRTQEILGELKDAPLEVTLYANLLSDDAGYGFPVNRNLYLRDLWEKYRRFKSDLVFKYEYYYAWPKGDSSLFRLYPGKSLKEIAGMTAAKYQIDSALFKSPEEVPEIGMLEAENYKLLMVLKYKGKESILRTFWPAGWPSEQNMNASLIHLLNKTAPEIYYVTGELERSAYKTGERELYSHSLDKRNPKSLVNIGFDVDTLNLAMQDIPAGTSLLVLTDPRTDLSTPVAKKLHDYIEAGGNMMILGEPGKQHLLNPLLRQTGVQLMNGQLVQPSLNETPEKIRGYVNKSGLEMAEEKLFKLCLHLWANGAMKDSAYTLHKGATSLSASGENGFKVTSVVMSQPNRSWLKQGMLIIDSVAPVFNPADGDSMEVSWPLAIQLTRMVDQKEQRIIVTGDADMLSNEVSINKTDLRTAMFSWLNYNNFPVYTNKPYAKDNRLVLTPERAFIQQIVFTWVIPTLLLVIAAIILIRRKRK